MPNLLIGHEVGGDLYRVNAQLRAETVSEYNKQAATSATFYSPWLSMFPWMPDQQMPQELLREPVFERGGLIIDSNYLEHARSFMAPRPEMTRNGIYDQAHTDWIPVTDLSRSQIEVFARGREVLLSSSPTLARLYLEFVDCVLPLEGQRNRGFSSHIVRGAIFRSIPDDCDEYDVAIDLVHELGHQCLIALQSIDAIMLSNPLHMIYSQIRRTLRPAIQTFHAAVALAFMHFFVTQMKDDKACEEAGRRRGLKYTDSLHRSLWLSLRSMEAECSFTPIGARILHEMRALT